MIVHPVPKKLQSKTLVEDLMSYSGSPTTESLSPYQGMMEVLRDQMRGSNGIIDFSNLVSYITTALGDYDSSKQKPVKGPYYRHEPDEVIPESSILMRLEDIDRSWLEAYVKSCVIGYKIRPAGKSAYNKSTKEAISFQNSEGEYLTDADLMKDTDNTTDLQILDAKTKLPYLLKQIHFKSKKLGVSLISMYGVFLQINGDESTPPRAMLAHTIYRMSPTGEVIDPYPPSANQNPGFGENLRYIKGANPDSYYKDLLEFRDVLDVLGIKLWEEDPKMFDEKFISNLVVKYVMSNNEFLWKGQRRDPTVLGALNTVSMNDFGVATERTEMARVMSFVTMFCESGSPELAEYLRDEDKGRLSQFLAMYAMTTNDPNFYRDEEGRLRPTLDEMFTYGGFYCLPDDGSPYPFDISNISVIPNARALLHSSGHLIVLTRNSHVYAVTCSEAVQGLLACRRSQGVPCKITWTSLGM